jgi:RHS repeat-associated protein
VKCAISTFAVSLTTYPFGQEEHEYQYPDSGSTMSVLEQRAYESLAGQLIAVRHASTSLNTDLLLTDTLGSVLASMSSIAGNASLLGNQVFGPYGKQRYSKGTIPTTKGYTGQYGDALTGLDSYVARSYDPVVGRFLSADTVESNLEGMDPYAYVGGNPQTMNDPSGHDDTRREDKPWISENLHKKRRRINQGVIEITWYPRLFRVNV